MGRQTDIGQKVYQSGRDLISPKHTYLSIFLLKEQFNPKSFWRPYFDVLPTDFNNFPIFFSQSQLQMLDGSPFSDVIQEQKTDIKKDYLLVCLLAPEFRQFTLDDYQWARMCCCSRIFGIQINGIQTDAFVPLADMLNHQHPKKTVWSYSDDLEGFCIEAKEEIGRGEEVFDSYGSQCNSRFLLNYGFIVPENEKFNQVIITLFRDDPQVQYSDLKQQCFKEYLLLQTLKISANFQQQSNFSIMGILRMRVLDDPKIIEILTETQGRRPFEPMKFLPINRRNEIQMFRKYRKILQDQMNLYPTTLDEDIEILKDPQLNFNQRNCVLYRKGEKQILNKMIQIYDYLASFQNLETREIQDSLNNHPDKQQLESYVNRLFVLLK